MKEQASPPSSDSPPGQSAAGKEGLKVALFVTCLADLFRPSVAFASITLLERAGCSVSVPLQQTCCGQPAYNAGDYSAAVPVAQKLIENFESADYVVVPSGSCAGMISHHYPRILEGQWRDRALALAAKTYELTAFLHDVAGITADNKQSPLADSVTYHDGCAGLRELDIKTQPRQLLQKLRGVEVIELQQSETCCGFGGTFCAKMPQISGKMVDDKLADTRQTGATILTGGDLGCLMQIAGRAQRLGDKLQVRHIAELLADSLDEPPIGQSGSPQ